MGAAIGKPDTSSQSSSSPPPFPPTSTYSAIPTPVRAGRYRRESGLRGSLSVPSFSTYWKVPVEDPEDGSGPPPGQNSGSGAPRVVKPSRSGPLGSDTTPYTGSPPSGRRWCHRGLSISVLIVLAFTLVYFGFLLGTAFLQRETLQFAIVLDGGSTGTRVHVHGWARSPKDPLPVMVDPTTNTHLPGAPMQVVNGRQRLYKRVETEPGLDKLYHNRTGIETALGPLLDWAGRHIPKHAYPNTQVFLLATAGLRRLPKNQREWILEQAWSVLAQSPFKCKKSSVKVIDGIEEAYYGWIALNYKFERLGASMPTKPNFGTLDLGGSSLEVTFEPRDVPRGDYGVNLSVGAADHHLYAASHAGFGLNDAFEKSVATLLRSQNATRKGKQVKNGLIELEHPCLQTGYREKYKCSTHCVLPPLSNAGPRHAPNTEAATGAQVELLGAPDWKACQNLAERIINTSSRCSDPPCALGKHQPYPQGQFYGLAGFYVVYKFFGLSQDAPLVDLLAKGQKFCKMRWKEAERSVDPQPSIEQYCFRSPYVTALLRDGLHLKDAQIQIGSGDFSWTLGAALWEAGVLNPVETSERGSGGISGYAPSLTTTVVVLLVLVFVLMGVTGYQWRQMRVRRRGYIPVATSGSPAMWLSAHLRNQARGETKTPQSPQPGAYYSAFSSEPPSSSLEVEGLQMLASSGIASAKLTPDRRLLQSRRTASREELNIV